MFFPFKIPLSVAEPIVSAPGSLQIPHEAAAHVNAGPSSHPQPWEQHPAAREQAEMGRSQELSAEPLTARLSGQISAVNRGGNL